MSDVLKNSHDQPGCEGWFRRAACARYVRSWTDVDVPGFVDIHVHGKGGGSFTVGDLAQVRHVVEFHRSGGTTNTPASLVTAPAQGVVAVGRDLELVNCWRRSISSDPGYQSDAMAPTRVRQLRDPDPEELRTRC